MRIKTSMTLSRETLDSLEELAREGLSKSRIVEIAVADLLERHRRRRRDAGDREILDRRALELNAEVEDILGYQVES
jgi:hypothetical protein